MTNSTRLGFTGTRRGMTQPQIEAFRNTVKAFDVKEWHHGDCFGADAKSHTEIKNLFPYATIVIHPPNNVSMRAWCRSGNVQILGVLPCLTRNQEIVTDTDVLVAAPGEMEEQQRSGTWSTVRYALRNGRFVLIVYPDGTSRTRAPK